MKPSNQEAKRWRSGKGKKLRKYLRGQDSDYTDIAIVKGRSSKRHSNSNNPIIQLGSIHTGDEGKNNPIINFTGYSLIIVCYEKLLPHQSIRFS